MQKHKGVYKVYHITVYEDFNRIFSHKKYIGKWSDFKFRIQINYPDLFYRHKIGVTLKENEVKYRINWPKLIDEMVNEGMI